ncbi:MAG: peptidase [Lachnospiraceae bacterium]|nr:peptidase [Candidatus Equihabitans merdae]
MEKYYYQKLNKTNQTVYHAMEQGLRAIAPEIMMPRVSARELADVFMMLRLDNPDIFWASGFKYKYYPDSPNLIFEPEYLFDKNKIKEHQKAMQARVARIARAAQDVSNYSELHSGNGSAGSRNGNWNNGRNGGKGKKASAPSDWDKEKYIHDFICDNITYDKLKKPYSHEIIGPLGQGVGVCEGIAKSVKILCDALNIWCIIALCDNNPDKGIKYRHTWNIVRIDGVYYHLDVTFDNSLTKGIQKLGEGIKETRYDYFNLDDANFFRDHEPVIYPAPKCSNHDHFYYKEMKKSFTKIEEVYKRSLQVSKKGSLLTFHWRGGYLTREVLDQILTQLRQAGIDKGKTARISLNWPQAVVSVYYTEGIPEYVAMEEANEGEQE